MCDYSPLSIIIHFMGTRLRRRGVVHTISCGDGEVGKVAARERAFKNLHLPREYLPTNKHTKIPPRSPQEQQQQNY